VSLRTRIAAVAGLAVAITVIAAAAIVYVAVRSNLRGEVERALDERATALIDDRRRGPGGPGPGGRRPGRHRPPPDQFGGAAGLVQRLGTDGSVLGGPASIPVSDAAREIAGIGFGRTTEEAEVDGIHLMVLTSGIDPSIGGAVQVARPLTEVDSSLRNVLTVLILVGVGGIGMAVLLGGVVARTALAPIGRFTRRTEAIAARPDLLSERMDVVGRDELARLAASFNTTLDSLERSVEAQRQLVADASHELRTPIASLRANIQTLEEADRLPKAELDGLRADILSELDELTTLVSDVVELARGAPKPSEALDDTRLDAVVRALVERAERRGDKLVRYVAAGLEPTLIRGDAERIGRAVSNLLDNARKWSPEGGEVEVTLRDGVLMVRDHGPGFAEEDLPRVFERFYRAGAARAMPGSGLGLSIVQQAAEAHGGFAEATNAVGGGGIVRVSFGPPLG
jgi:two-component system sensor histidine kinase MprB